MKIKLSFNKILNIIFITLFLVGIGYSVVTTVAETYILADEVNTTTLNADNGNITEANITGATIDTLYSDDINSVLYVQAGNASDIQATIDSSPTATGGGEVYVVGGNYALTDQVNLTSNLTLIIMQGVSIYWDSSATPLNWTDQQTAIYNTLFYGNGLTNLKIFNYGILEPNRNIDIAGVTEMVTLINDTTNIYIHGGHIKGGANTAGYTIFNSEDINIENLYSDNMSVSIWQECTNRTIMDNLIGIAGGTEGELVDMNGYSRDVTISNVIHHGGMHIGVDQVLDLNANQRVTLNNIIGIDAYKLVHDSTIAGIRWGICTAITGSDIKGTNLICNNCNVSSVPNTVNSTWFINDDSTTENTTNYYGGIKINSVSTASDSYGLYVDSDSNGLRIDQSSSLGGATNYFEPNYPALKLNRVSSRGSTLLIGHTSGYMGLYGDSTTLEFYNSSGIKYLDFNTKGVMQIGDGGYEENCNITMTSPDSSEFCCGVANDASFSCSAGAC